jgi:hypothetical protein
MLRKCNIIAAVISALILAGFPVTPVSAQSDGAVETPAVPGLGTLKGSVRGADGKGRVGGAIVHAYHVDSSTLYSSEPTASNGEYRIKNLSHGYYDLAIEIEGAVYVANTIVNMPPSGTVSITIHLTDFADLPPEMAASLRTYEFPELERPTEGVAEIDQALRGRDFWRSKKGLAILVGGGAVLLLGIALSSKESDDTLPVSPSTP